MTGIHHNKGLTGRFMVLENNETDIFRNLCTENLGTCVPRTSVHCTDQCPLPDNHTHYHTNPTWRLYVTPESCSNDLVEQKHHLF